MTGIDDHRYMARALSLARRGLDTADPNPRVGCVLVKDDNIVGEGWHERAGKPHAEVNALQQAGSLARGASAYITLEPCCHHGRTAPCTDALINAGIVRVVAAIEDPNPLVAGRGSQQLEDAGIDVIVGLMEEQALAVNPGFIQRFKIGRPFVRCKLAMSLDGRTAMASGESQWITSAGARKDVQKLRARSSAIMTGIGTVLADDPSLNVRANELMESGLDQEDVRQPLRIVLDSDLQMPVSSRMLSLGGSTMIITSSADQKREKALQDAGADVIRLPAGEAGLDLNTVMTLLAERQINELMVEAGPVLSGALLYAGLIDELVVYLAPHLMGDQAQGLFHLPGLEKMEHRVAMQIKDIRAVGDDWRLTCVVAGSKT